MVGKWKSLVIPAMAACTGATRAQNRTMEINWPFLPIRHELRVVIPVEGCRTRSSGSQWFGIDGECFSSR